jgi:uncharacterized membrane protein
MEFLAPFHPQIIHAPIALIVVGFLFELIGRALDRAWWRKAAFAMLVVGVMGAALAVLSGLPAGQSAEHHGVSEEAVDAHEEMALLTLWLGIAAVVARVASTRLAGVGGALSVLALLLHLATAVCVGVAAHRGGMLVYEHGAAVRVNGRTVREAPPETTPVERH